MAMATDYDAPRRTETDEVSEDSLEELTPAARSHSPPSSMSTSPSPRSRSNCPVRTCPAKLSVRVVPKQADEFTCSSCFLVHHRSRLASEKNGEGSARTARLRGGQLRSADNTRSGWRLLASQYGVGSSGSSRTSSTIGPTQLRCNTKAAGSS